MVKRAKGHDLIAKFSFISIIIISASKWWNGQKGHEFLATLLLASLLRLNMRASIVNTQDFSYRL